MKTAPEGDPIALHVRVKIEIPVVRVGEGGEFHPSFHRLAVHLPGIAVIEMQAGCLLVPRYAQGGSVIPKDSLFRRNSNRGFHWNPGE
jgi:hypothetical protein